jgi:hypothetical protein
LASQLGRVILAPEIGQRRLFQLRRDRRERGFELRSKAVDHSTEAGTEGGVIPFSQVSKAPKQRSRRTTASDATLARAYRELEPEICDVVRAAELASLAEDQEDSGLLTFAIEQFLRLAEELKQRYYDEWKD